MNRLVILLPAIIWLFGTTVEAQVPDAFYSVVAAAGGSSGIGSQTIGGSGATPRNAAVDFPVHVHFPGDDSNPPFGYDLDQHAHAEAFGGANPQAVATAAASATSTDQSPLAIASANATVVYYLHLLTVNAGLVWHPTQIPVNFHARAEVTGAASASVSLVNASSGALVFADNAAGHDLPDPRPGFDRQLSFSIAPDDYLKASLFANAQAYADTENSTSDVIFSHALADPDITFDQDAFDLYAASLGQPTFNLSDFFAFEFSPTVDVPEPSSAMLLLFGGAFYLCRRTLRTNQRSA